MECYIVVKNYIYRQLVKVQLCSKKFHHSSKRVTETLVNPKEFLDFLISFPSFFFLNQRCCYTMVLKQEKLVGEEYNPHINLYPHKKTNSSVLRREEVWKSQSSEYLLLPFADSTLSNDFLSSCCFSLLR